MSKLAGIVKGFLSFYIIKHFYSKWIKYFCLIIFLSYSFGGKHKSLFESAEIILNTFNDQAFGTDFNWRDISPALHEIGINGHLLSHSTQEELKNIGFNFSGKIVNRTLDLRSEASNLDQYYDTGVFRFHYTVDGNHGVDQSDSNSNAIPDYIEIMAETFVHVYDIQINEMGYTRPPGDAWIESYPGDYDYGGSNHYDVYVRRLSSSYYGYVQSEYTAQNTGNNEFSPNVNEQNAFTSYMAMRNNYNGFPQSELESIQVTAAHEFLHAIQYGYDGYEKPWLLEATAVWIEEEIYDEINDCYQYMNSWFNQPEKSLDHVGGTHWYGSWIFFEYIDDHLGGAEMIKLIFDEGVSTNSEYGNFSHQAIDDALTTIGSSFKEALNGMAIANVVMSSSPGDGAEMYSYKEAEDFPIDGPNIYQTINYSDGDVEIVQSTSLNKLASQYIKIITETPVLITLDSLYQADTTFGFHCVIEYSSGDYSIISGDSSLSVYNSLESADAIYAVIVSQDQNVIDYNYTLKIETANTPPVSFLIESPETNSRISDLYPDFIWEPSKDNNLMDSLFYVLELGKNIEHLEVVYDGTEPYYSPSEPLSENIVYYWQVYAYDLGNNRTYNSNGIHRFFIRTSEPEQEIMLTNVYPNPFPYIDGSINSVRFTVFLEIENYITVTVTDLLGRKIADIFEGHLNPGFYDLFAWDGYNMNGNKSPSGVYFFIIDTESQVKIHKITLIR